MERAATAEAKQSAFARDVHLLFEQMYDAIERRMINRDELRDLTDNLSDVVMPLTMVGATPALVQEFERPELNGLCISGVKRAVLSHLEKNFGKVVRKDSICAIIASLSSKPDAINSKNCEVVICAIRAALRATPYGIKTLCREGYSLVSSDQADVYSGKMIVANHALGRYAKINWRGVYVTAPVMTVLRYLEDRPGQLVSRDEIMSALKLNRNVLSSRISTVRAIVGTKGVKITTKKGQRNQSNEYMFVEAPK